MRDGQQHLGSRLRLMDILISVTLSPVCVSEAACAVRVDLRARVCMPVCVRHQAYSRARVGWPNPTMPTQGVGPKRHRWTQHPTAHVLLFTDCGTGYCGTYSFTGPYLGHTTHKQKSLTA